MKKNLILTVMLLVALVASSIFGGVVFQHLWSWFAVPVFGAPPLSLPYAVGVAMIVSFLVFQDTSGLARKEPDEDVWVSALSSVATAFVVNAAFLIQGAIVHQFV